MRIILKNCASPHPSNSAAAIVVSRRCFISLQLSILHPSRWFDWLSLANDFPVGQAGKRKAGHIMPGLWCVFSSGQNHSKKLTTL
jgi:hypothetical protein